MGMRVQAAVTAARAYILGRIPALAGRLGIGDVQQREDILQADFEEMLRKLAGWREIAVATDGDGDDDEEEVD